MRRVALAALLLASACHSAPAAKQASIARTAAGDVELTGRVVDKAGIIPPAEEAKLSKRSEALERDTTDQLVVVTLPTLRGASIESVGKALGSGWGIGRADVDNGVMLLVAPAERKVRIEVGLGLEGLLTNEKAAQVIQHMLPSFSANKPVEAISMGVDDVAEILEADKRRPQRLILRKAA